MFKLVFDHLFALSSRMQYWKGEVTTQREGRKDVNPEFEEELLQGGDLKESVQDRQENYPLSKNF